MDSKWQRLSLREAGISLIDCVHKTPEAKDNGYPYVAIPQMKDGRIDLSSTRKISHDDFLAWTIKAKPRANDVVLSRRCNPGESAYVKEGVEFALGQNLVLLRSDGNKVHKPYLRWLLNSPFWWAEVQKFMNVGAIFTSLKCADVLEFTLPIPPLNTQVKISEILYSIDKKIELNNQINQTLEAMAQAIFKSWFVDFEPVKAKIAALEAGEDAEGVTRAAMSAISGKTDEDLDQLQAEQLENYTQLKTTAELFPSAMQDSEFGEIPEGWKVEKLKNNSNQIIRGFTSKYVEKSNLINLNQKVNRGIYLDKSNFKYYPENTKVSEEKFAKKKDILINSLGQGTLGRVHLFWEDVHNIVIDQHITVVRTNYVSLYPEYLHNYLSYKETQSRLESLVTGTTGMLMLNVSKIRDFSVLVPDADIQREFSSVVSDFYSQKYKNTMENEVLSQLRDSLLPKLLSGELSVDIAEFAEEK
ncbi:MAG: restriction endonuclease subunit S [Methanosarcinaceae archaeon]|nr:restriction endonuclease subunit S [Methanosarcinaceae archaeon]